MVDVNAAQLEKALITIGKNFESSNCKRNIKEDDKKNALANINTQTEITKGVTNAELIIEAATEIQI